MKFRSAVKIVLPVILTAISGSAFAQATASVTTTGSATLIQPITLTQGTGLAFGTIVRPGTGTGTVTIDSTTGARTLANGVVGLGSTTSRAAYTVNGEGGSTFSIAVPATFNLTGPSTIAVALTPTGSTGTLSNALGTAGTAGFGVGGNFSVGSTTATGTYSGTYDVTVAYN
jgi:Domain of unknown function (DUF4402)